MSETPPPHPPIRSCPCQVCRSIRDREEWNARPLHTDKSQDGFTEEQNP